MKKISLFTLLVLIVPLCTSAMARIQGSQHDLSVSGIEQEICVFCHTPAGAPELEKPLWEKNISTTRWTDFANAGKKKRSSQNLLVSKMCLSCHDSTLGQEMLIDSSPFIKNHPIGSNMRAISKRKMLIPEAPLNRALKLFNYRVECATCHDVHNSTDYHPLLVMQNVGSALCLSCHLLNRVDTSRIIEEKVAPGRSSEETIEQESDTVDTFLPVEEGFTPGRSSEKTIGQEANWLDTFLPVEERAVPRRSGEEAIKQEMDTLDRKVGALEQKVSELDSRTGALESKVNTMTAELDAAKKAVADALAQVEALIKSADRTEDAAKRAEAAVDQAAAAVGRAETAAKKAEKALDLLQKK